MIPPTLSRLVKASAAAAVALALLGGPASLAQTGRGGGHGPLGGVSGGGVSGPGGGLGGGIGGSQGIGGGGLGRGLLDAPLPSERGDLGRELDGKAINDRGRDAIKDLEAKSGRARGQADAVVDGLGDTTASIAALTQSRQQQVRRLLKAHRDVVEADGLGQPVVRGEILALAPSPAALAMAQRAGFRLGAQSSLPELGLQSVVLLAPRGTSAVEALRRLRQLDPQGRYDFNHLYQQSGQVAGKPVRTATAVVGSAPALSGVKVGLVDGAVAEGQPALAGASLVQRTFAPGGPQATPHATAVASLIAGRQGPFHGAAPGASLYVADVYGRTPTGGSAEAIVRALGWLAQVRAPVINISLVGPPNILLEAAVKALIARGHLIVAAVGNDGPAAPPLYPAAYPGVVAVTAVDSRRRILPEAGRGPHVDFAAPGAEMAAAGTDGGFVSVRGTSFAAPIAAGLLARYLPAPDPAAAQLAVAKLGGQAVDLGARGPDPLFGHGLVGADLRTPPALVQARYALRGP